MATQNVEEIPGLLQLFVLRDPDGSLLLAIPKVVDDFSICWFASQIEVFHASIAKRFEVGGFILGGDLIFNRLRISQANDGSVHLNMREYMDKILLIDVPALRRERPKKLCTTEEIKLYQGLAGSLNFLGHGILPQACFVASPMQQSIVR